jgi:hypothetical protein
LVRKFEIALFVQRDRSVLVWAMGTRKPSKDPLQALGSFDSEPMSLETYTHYILFICS